MAVFSRWALGDPLDFEPKFKIRLISPGFNPNLKIRLISPPQIWGYEISWFQMKSADLGPYLKILLISPPWIQGGEISWICVYGQRSAGFIWNQLISPPQIQGGEISWILKLGDCLSSKDRLVSAEASWSPELSAMAFRNPADLQESILKNRRISKSSAPPKGLEWAPHLRNIVWISKNRTAQHSTTQHSTAQHNTAQHSTAQHGTVNLRPAL